MAKSDFRVVMIEPEYEINMGYVARIMDNFGLSELYLVNPKVPVGFKARMFAKHARWILERARIVGNWGEGMKGCDVIVGTTAKTQRSIPLVKAVERLGGIEGKIAIVLGRDGTGLTVNEQEKCHVLATIPANKKNSSLNISHALAIVLYELTKMKMKKKFRNSGRKVEGEQVETLMKLIEESVSILKNEKKGFRDPKKVSLCMRKVFSRAVLDEVENGAFIIFFKRVLEKIDGK